MDFERFEEYLLQMAARHEQRMAEHEQRMAQLDEKLAEITQIQAGLAIGHAKSQAESAARASRFDKQMAESAAEFDRRMAQFDAGMEDLRKEGRLALKAIQELNVALNRLMDRQTRHEQDPDAHRNLPRPA